MEITLRLHTHLRQEWRKWLLDNHTSQKEVWLSVTQSDNQQGVLYLDAVEEALCFGWIDSTGKREDGVRWQRFSPRRKGSSWTELNKERCKRLERLGLMTDAGRAVIPDAPFVIDNEIVQALKADEVVWRNFSTLPELYVRIRIDNIQKLRRRDAEKYRMRLAKFIDNTRQGVMYGEWHDGGRLL